MSSASLGVKRTCRYVVYYAWGKKCLLKLYYAGTKLKKKKKNAAFCGIFSEPLRKNYFFFLEVPVFIKQEKDVERRDLVALIDSAMDGPVSLDVILYATRSKNKVWFMFKFIFAEIGSCLPKQ